MIEKKKAVQKVVQVGQVDKNGFICMFLTIKTYSLPPIMKDTREKENDIREKENMPYLLRYRSLLSDKMQESGDFSEFSLWTDGDFQRLMDLIQEKTTVILSVSTLKRALGKQKSKSFPTDATLNTLAKFLIDKDWEEFKKLPITDSPEEPIYEEKTPKSEVKSSKLITWAVAHQRHLALALSLFAIALVGIALPSPFLKP